MPSFMIAYRGYKEPESGEVGARQMAQWKAWLDELGDAVVNPGTPLKNSTTVSADGVSTDAGAAMLTGFTVVKADSMEMAIGMAKACPFVEVGALQVAEIAEMKQQPAPVLRYGSDCGPATCSLGQE